MEEFEEDRRWPRIVERMVKAVQGRISESMDTNSDGVGEAPATSTPAL